MEKKSVEYQWEKKSVEVHVHLYRGTRVKRIAPSAMAEAKLKKNHTDLISSLSQHAGRASYYFNTCDTNVFTNVV